MVRGDRGSGLAERSGLRMKAAVASELICGRRRPLQENNHGRSRALPSC